MGFININTLSIGFLAIFLLYKGFPRKQKHDLVTPGGLPVPIGVGRDRSFVNQTGDAGLYTEQHRRRVLGKHLVS
jgi:hypothetical protein